MQKRPDRSDIAPSDGIRAPASPEGIRLIAIDLDGTLLDTHKRVTPATVDALRQLSQRGVKIVLASARPPRSVRHIYQALSLDTWQINYNGALIWDEPRKQAIFHLPIPAEPIQRIVAAARQKFEHVLVSCEVMDRWYTDRAEQPYTTETGLLFRPDSIAPLADFLNQPITKLLLLGDVAMIDDLEHLVADLRCEHTYAVRTDPELLQVMHRNVSKSAALRMTVEQYGVPLAQMMAIGDAPNDVGMLQLAGIAVAMGNAHPRVKQEAHWIGPSNNEEGVLAALRHFGLIG
jgi:5-amino-6-(5-phospho-D-ribitylamino)uracil phosphatase